MAVEKTSLHSSPTRETAWETLAELRQEYGDKASTLGSQNEATTRLLVIDRVLEALGWKKEDFNPEHLVSHVGFTDYLITADSIPRFIVEAKKGSTTFGRSQSGMKRTEYQLNYVRSAFGQAVSGVINQAEGYSKQTGVLYAVITNGAEWLLIQAIPFRNRSINDLQCTYFGNLFSETSNFELFWNLLAKPYVLEGSLEEHFSQLNALPADFCKTPNSKLPELSWSRSDDSERYIREFYDNFFDEIIHPSRRMMLRECFVTNSKLDQYQGELKRALQDTAPTYIPEAKDIAPDYENPEFSSLDLGDRKGRVIIITGSVGSGKSTLVHKVLYEAREKSRESKTKFNYLIVDLINEVDGKTQNINSYLWQEVSKRWKQLRPESCKLETLRKIFGRELSELRNSSHKEIFEKDPQFLALREAELLEKLLNSASDFLEKSWKHYASQNRKGVVVFLDNVDRNSDDYQKVVYAFAHEIANQTGATVIITMREGTYFRGQEFGFLDVRSDDKVYHLQAPDLKQILSKRTEYVESLLEEEPEKRDNRLSDWRNRPDWQQFYDAALRYAGVIKSTFQTSETANQSITLLASVSWHDVRYFLSLLRDLHLMLGSELSSWSSSYMIAALLMPSSLSRSRPILPNIYYPVYPTYPCYFLKLRLLLRLYYGKHSSELRRGTTLTSLLSFTKMYAYHERWTRLTVREMVRERLLECIEIPSEADFTKDYELEESHSFRVSPLAVVMIKQVYSNIIYLSIIGSDLPYHRSNAFEKYVAAVREVRTLLSDEPLTGVGIDLILETKASSVVARYLVETFEEEQPIGEVMMHFPEVSATEEKFRGMITQLLGLAGVSLPNPLSTSIVVEELAATQKITSDIFQPSLFEISNNSDTLQSESSIQVPGQINDANLTLKGLAPKIFWAIVELRARSKKQVTGSEVAEVINQYLVNDLTKVEATNVSRALRGPTLQSQAWLTTQHIAPRKKLYGLSEDWQNYWEQVFEEPPPNLK